MKRGREHGLEGLPSHPPVGPTPRLMQEQRAHFPGLLKRGAEAFGFRGNPLDGQACRRHPRTRVWYTLSPRPCLEVAPKHRVESITAECSRSSMRKLPGKQERCGLFSLADGSENLGTSRSNPEFRVLHTLDHLSAINIMSPDGVYSSRCVRSPFLLRKTHALSYFWMPEAVLPSSAQ